MKIVKLLKMYKFKAIFKLLNILFILSFLSSCSGELNFNRTKYKNNPFTKSEQSKIKDKLEITISCEEESIEKYLKDGWKIKNKEINEKVCSWKSIPANKTCDLEKDKGCKIITPNKIGTETIYLLEK